MREYDEPIMLSEKLSQPPQQTPSEDIGAEATKTVWSFIKTSLKRLTEDYEMKMEVQEEARSRISELGAQEIISFYNRLNEHEVESFRSMAALFMPREGKNSTGTTILDTLKNSETSVEQTLHDKADPETLKGLQKLSDYLKDLGTEKPLALESDENSTPD